jgi:hypothetical protein
MNFGDYQASRLKLYEANQLPYQSTFEIRSLIRLLEINHVQSVLEIGSLEGDTLLVWLFLSNVEDIVAVDKTVPETDPRYHTQKWVHTEFPKRFEELGTNLSMYDGYSAEEGTVNWVERRLEETGKDHFDLLYIDGGHTYGEVRADFEFYGPMSEIIAFHDVLNPLYPEVNLYWDSLKGTEKNYFFFEFYDPKKKMGTGVMLPRYLRYV